MIYKVNHPELGTLNAELASVSEDPDGQVADVINMMAGYVEADYRSPRVRADATEALSRYGPDPAAAVFHHIKSKVRFVRDEEISEFLGDPDIVEVLIRPRDMSELVSSGTARGDCDCFVMYGAAMLKALGERDVRFVTVAADSRDPERFSHVYLVVYRDGNRIPLDLSHGDRPGWETGEYYRRREWPLNGGAWGWWILIAVIGVIYYDRRRNARVTS